jgi:hypothetical protein
MSCTVICLQGPRDARRDLNNVWEEAWSEFCRIQGRTENCDLLGHYAANGGNFFLFTSTSRRKPEITLSRIVTQ